MKNAKQTISVFLQLTTFTQLLCSTALAAPGILNFNLEATKGLVKFEAIGRPSLLRITGQGAGATGDLAIQGTTASGVLSFPLDSLVTGISLRDRHMKDKYLQIAQHPSAELKLQSVSLPADWKPENSTAVSGPFKGVLNLHGVAKEVEGQFTTAGFSEGKLSVVANFNVHLSDFAIGVPTYAGLTVADEVKIEVNAGLNLKPPTDKKENGTQTTQTTQTTSETGSENAHNANAPEKPKTK